MYKIRIINLIFIFLLLFILVDLEVAELVALLGVRHHTQPVTKVVFLQVLLCQILQVSAQQETKTVSAIKFVIVIFFYSLQHRKYNAIHATNTQTCHVYTSVYCDREADHLRKGET